MPVPITRAPGFDRISFPAPALVKFLLVVATKPYVVRVLFVLKVESIPAMVNHG